jgi:hypothetical protein
MIPRSWAANPALSRDLRVAVAILSFAGPGGCFPTIATVAEVCGLPRIAVKRALKRLRDNGALVIAERPGAVSHYAAIGLDPARFEKGSAHLSEPTVGSRSRTNVSRGSAHSHAQNRFITDPLTEYLTEGPQKKETTEERVARFSAGIQSVLRKLA